MNFNSSVIDIIKERKSKRTYTNHALSTDIIEKIQQLLSYYKLGPMGNIVSFSLIEKEFAKENHKVKIGTYGFISGAQYFISGEVKKGAFCFEDFGYLLEKIILHLTELKHGTCWLGGTFNRSDFAKILNSDKEILIPAITPVGYADDTKTIMENIIRWAAKANNRLEWNQLFFNNNFSNPLQMEEAKDYELPLEMVRLAPSASNKQPWRIIKSNGNFHFYLKRTSGYKMFGNVDLQKVDMGIAMAHFELTCNQLGLIGNWKNNKLVLETSQLEYIISWQV